ncbi:MAG TPA: tetratricopeptide repeat protein, partial [Spirochaetia bacterium]|nr:tetratricopeptide repeat protein [Spirochaetia bacterium]
IADFPDAIFYRKSDGSTPRLPSAESAPAWYPEPPPLIKEELPTGEEIRREEQTFPLNAQEMDAPIAVARALANQGELAEALSWCDRAVLSDPLNPAHRFLRAMVAQELGRLEEAARFFEQALYLDQDFVMAHFALGNVAKRLGRYALSRRHFSCALSLIKRLEPGVSLPESAGLTAGRLMEIIRLSLDKELETS